MDAQEALKTLRKALAEVHQAATEGRAVIAQLESLTKDTETKPTQVNVFAGHTYDVEVGAHSPEGAQVREDLLRDALSVLLELRAQPGAGRACRSGVGWVMDLTSDDDEAPIFDCRMLTLSRYARLCPCFPSEPKLMSAIHAVGRTRVERALRVFAMLPVEVSQ